LRAPQKKQARRPKAPVLSARLSEFVTLEAQADGNLFACFEGYSVDDLGKFGAGAVDRRLQHPEGLPLRALAPAVKQETNRLVRRLARRGLLEYRLGRSGDDPDATFIEPQLPDYWPQVAKLRETETIVLSRFAYLRRRGDEMVLESPRAGALFRISDPQVAAALARLSRPQQIKEFRRQDGYPGAELLALLVDCGMLFRIETAGGEGLRSDEGDDSLVLWDFHDLLFHTHSTVGRQANPLGGLYPYAGMIAPLPAVRPRWPGTSIDLHELSDAASPSPLASLLRQRHSTRSFDAREPITLAELARLLDGAARVQSTWQGRIEELGDDSPEIDYAPRPYPSAGSAYALELYLAVADCAGLARGFYHYDADQHALVPVAVRAPELEAQLRAAQFAMDAPDAPQVLITIAARFGRVSWKYSSLAYALILKDAGVLTQTLYLMATEMGLGGCAIGSINIDLFARMTGIEFHVEGPVGQFAIGRGSPMEAEG
jgi:SagB-type dehydrogenase family enzyme